MSLQGDKHILADHCPVVTRRRHSRSTLSERSQHKSILNTPHVRGYLDLAKGVAFGACVRHDAGEAELAALEEALGPQWRVTGRMAGSDGEEGSFRMCQ